MVFPYRSIVPAVNVANTTHTVFHREVQCSPAKCLVVTAGGAPGEPLGGSVSSDLLRARLVRFFSGVSS